MWRTTVRVLLWGVVPAMLAAMMLVGSREVTRLNVLETDMALVKRDLDPTVPGFRYDVLQTLIRLEHCCCETRDE